jgi:hypothetical protein
VGFSRSVALVEFRGAVDLDYAAVGIESEINALLFASPPPGLQNPGVEHPPHAVNPSPEANPAGGAVLKVNVYGSVF